MNAINTLKAMTAKQDTDTLMGALFILDAKGDLTEAERLTHAVTSDVITERHGLEGLIDELLHDLDFEGNYTDALLIALAKVAA